MPDIETTLFNMVRHGAGENYTNSINNLESTVAGTVLHPDWKSDQKKNTQLTAILSLWMSYDALDEVDTYTGLSSHLLLLINRIAELSSPHNNKEQICMHRRQVNLMKAILQTLRQQLPQDLDYIMVLQVSACAEVYRLASLLFLHHKVSLVRARLNFRTTLSPLFSDAEIFELVNQILDHFHKTPALTRTAAIPLWPLFIAGCSTGNNDDLRVKVLETFDNTESTGRFGVGHSLTLSLAVVFKFRYKKLN